MHRQTFMGIVPTIAVVLPVTAPADLTPVDSRKPLPQVALTDSKGVSISPPTKGMSSCSISGPRGAKAVRKKSPGSWSFRTNTTRPA